MDSRTPEGHRPVITTGSRAPILQQPSRPSSAAKPDRSTLKDLVAQLADGEDEL